MQERVKKFIKNTNTISKNIFRNCFAKLILK